ncbi:bifunctional histidinol-phosphatase/imidazoleglycerol-phosphate dehydratase HisB [Buchnera aphidicola]|uniref:Histidine biosynthesis bifunctional protein HisB n=1 Tax=Buchnera aphidicola subsp. Schizaphis graminum (strain Sg) TaxID=198804 RepID=HIS7_BUCAP|nr:bifunctional histidinol-phosphatase/imidazoleglycerol-phosphate dehydratase HisB [Buchnera aphidicola]Q9ZHE4.1 RecName: Full=Histidine biosynthesis bifunctional protein HisB; Includes: RecName: Full=Histidinol-phosphatase; Includes: RecName: Full=Imidazoleglycerol-phosphate dehydratase; Short=IGPD [Buchnera aphidicola str. Sg (Schizaphis graminum)]AAC97357.1 imidazoleglycerolphosphate dehydratase/ histidinolphosphate phosphatase [Buchnera aphidicola]AAM67665.1 histidine biosynthesis bifunctio
MKQKILFIDRDGTLIHEPSNDCQVDAINKLEFKKYIISSLCQLMNFGYKFVMVTNQDGLGSKSFPRENFNIPHFFMLNIFRSEGIIFEDVLICPHFLDDNCDCRKPQTKLLKPWLKKNKIDKQRSYVIGDRETDMELAKNINLTGIQYKEKEFNWIDITKEIIKRNRYREVIRETKETYIHIKLWLDLEHHSCIQTGINFFDHMLEQLSIHSGISMYILAKGDLQIDDHHTIEDTGIVLGEALSQALNNKNGLSRYGFVLPMDESQAKCIIDLSNRPYLSFNAHFKHKMVGDMNTDMVEHFFYSLCCSMKITLHIDVKGKNDHHCIESLFKAFGRALRKAVKIEGNTLPTSKGIL